MLSFIFIHGGRISVGYMLGASDGISDGMGLLVGAEGCEDVDGIVEGALVGEASLISMAQIFGSEISCKNSIVKVPSETVVFDSFISAV